MSCMPPFYVVWMVKVHGHELLWSRISVDRLEVPLTWQCNSNLIRSARAVHYST